MKNTQKGRSMVEMLGVLAIIGVLSVGGIAGYTVAMNRYRANQILDMASKTAIIAQTLNGGIGGTACTGSTCASTATASGMAWTTTAGVSAITATATEGSDQVSVTLGTGTNGSIPTGVQDAMANIVGNGVSYTKPGTLTITTN